MLTAGPVSAHSALQSSTPADQAELVQPPTAVTLTFNEAVDSEFSDVVVTGPDGQARQEGATQVQGSTVTQPLRPLTEDGRYDVAYRVVSADGHPITGELSFTVTLPPTTAPASTAPATGAAPSSAAGSSAAAESAAGAAAVTVAPAAAQDDASSAALPLLVGLIAAVVVLGGAAAVVARRRTAGQG